MKLLNKLFGAQEIKAMLGTLEEAECAFQSYPAAFAHVRRIIEEGIKKQSKELIATIRETERSPRLYVYSYISNIAGDLAESGQHHIYRGVLSPLGEQFLSLYDTATDELVKAGDVDSEYAEEQKVMLRKGIASVG